MTYTSASNAERWKLLDWEMLLYQRHKSEMAMLVSLVEKQLWTLRMVRRRFV